MYAGRRNRDHRLLSARRRLRPGDHRQSDKGHGKKRDGRECEEHGQIFARAAKRSRKGRIIAQCLEGREPACGAAVGAAAARSVVTLNCRSTHAVPQLQGAWMEQPPLSAARLLEARQRRWQDGISVFREIS